MHTSSYSLYFLLWVNTERALHRRPRCGAKRFGLFDRCLVMTQVRTTQADMLMGLTVTAGVISWQAAAVTLAALLVSGVLRLLTEWQRRQTIKALMSGVAKGTTVVVSEDQDGHSFRLSRDPVPARRPIARS